MKYIVTIFVDEKEESAYTDADWARLDTGYATFYRTAVERGYTVEGGALEPPSKAKTLRVRQNKVLVTDGPFAETKEWFGGYFVIEAPDFDAVAAVCQLMPVAQDHGVEIRALEPPKG